ncbi:MAG TPA: nucleoside triphosphate pyrophosphohydrolase [Candidatus Megaira endosymbiont of Nemacystus decipiens]|nr:nucleoside triphosphate pyrophosphohydrolase [Candidatus Megaera endosymbiont of Nemacystus decipiens]
MIKYHFNKLIRNKLPQRMKEEGVYLNAKKLTPQEYKEQLKLKIIEEAHEVAESKEKQELTIELADLLEVIYELAKTNDIKIEEIEEERQKKLQINGAFSPDCYANYVEAYDDNQKFIDYMKSKNKKYVMV